MQILDAVIPWRTQSLWSEANATIAHLLDHRRPALQATRRLADQIRERLASLFPLMVDLCHATCPTCSDICCQHAFVWIDFKDLLFLHLAAVPLPDRQLREKRGDRCRYAAPDGCSLDRLQRPFVCTWYLCPAQTRILREHPAPWHQTQTCLQHIKQLRRQMENAFIQAIVG